MITSRSSQWILDILEQHKKKITAGRKQIADVVAGWNGIFSRNQIIDQVSTVDRVTVYRILDLFEQFDIIHKTTTHDGEQFYEVHQKAHTHHVVCTVCGKSKPVACTIEVEDVPGFSQIHHTVAFTGVCHSCA